MRYVLYIKASTLSNSATMKSFFAYLGIFLILAMSRLSLGNVSLARFKRETPKPPPEADDEDQLVYSTKTTLQSLSFKYTSDSAAKADQFSTVVQEDSYIVNVFDISFEQGLALYGIDNLFGRSIG